MSPVAGQVRPRMADDLSLELPFGLVAASVARRFVADAVSGIAADTVADATLLTSEIVTNAVRHGAPPARLAITTGPDRLRVSVHDFGPEVLHSGRIPDVLAVGGRGLLIVDSIADSWGVATDSDDGGKSVWFELELH